MKKALLKNRMITVLAAILMLISLSYGSISFAGSAGSENDSTYCMWYHRRVYYTDATFTTSTGQRVWFCDGLVGQGGPATPYYQDFYCDCDPEGGE
jgi:hypothetical protein